MTVPTVFSAYLRGIETTACKAGGRPPAGFQPTYEELKHDYYNAQEGGGG